MRRGATGDWQAYDVAFRRPRFGSNGRVLEPARVSVIHNGIVVQNNETILGPTNWLKWVPYERHEDRASIKLQDHGHRVRFRNIWLVELAERREPTVGELDRAKPIAVRAEELEQFVGGYSSRPDADASKLTTISRGDGHLVLNLPGVPSRSHVLLPIGPGVFEMGDSDVRMVFQKDERGRVFAAVLRVGGEERTLEHVRNRPAANAAVMESARKQSPATMRIIVFGAHPDDCELEAGGTAARGRSLATRSSSSA